MADEYLSRAEFAAWREAMERRVDHKVSTDVWAMANTQLQQQNTETRAMVKEQIAEVDRDCRERNANAVKASAKAVDDLKKTKQTTWSWAAQIIGWAIALGAAVIAAKGIK